MPLRSCFAGDEPWYDFHTLDAKMGPTVQVDVPLSGNAPLMQRAGSIAPLWATIRSSGGKVCSDVPCATRLGCSPDHPHQGRGAWNCSAPPIGRLGGPRTLGPALHFHPK